MNKIQLDKNLDENDFIDEELFDGENFRKIKKKLIYEIASARIREILDIMIFKNINLKYHTQSSKKILHNRLLA